MFIQFLMLQKLYSVQFIFLKTILFACVYRKYNKICTIKENYIFVNYLWNKVISTF